MANILIVDDNRSIRRILAEILETRKYTVRSVASGRACLEIITQEKFDLILLDIKMQGMDGLETLNEIKLLNLKIPIIMMSAHGSDETAEAVRELGAFHYIEKPFNSHQLLEMIVEGLKHGRLIDQGNTPDHLNRNSRSSKEIGPTMIGSCPKFIVMKEAMVMIAPTNLRVLIEGPNGAGKELVARSIHNQSLRRKKRFVEVNCAAIPGELIESLLFGHVKGVFTGASKETVGLFQQAEGGTIFLDEIGDMPYSAQTKILRVLEEEKITKVGGNKEIPIDVRVIAATNQNLAEMIFAKKFREDLYYRLEEFVIRVPALSERKADIPELVNFFVTTFSRDNGRTPPEVEKEAMMVLQQIHYSGNIRQLRNIVKRLLVISGASITVADVNRFAPSLVSQQREIIEMNNLVRKLGGMEAAIVFIRKNFKEQDQK